MSDPINIVSRNLKPYIILLTIIGGGLGTTVAYLWSEYKSLQKDELAFRDSKLAFQKSQNDFEKLKIEFDLNQKVKAEKIEKANQQLILDRQQLDKDRVEFEKDKTALNTSYKDELNKKIAEYNKQVSDFSKLKENISFESQKIAADKEIQKTMSDFADLEVDLRHPDWCDKEYTKKYYKGEALLAKISAINSKFNISEEYNWYVKSKSKSVTSSSDGKCEN